MKMVGITPCYRITLENGSYGVETYIDADSKIQITFEDGNTLIGYIECVEYGTYSDENDTLVIRVENGELYTHSPASLPSVYFPRLERYPLKIVSAMRSLLSFSIMRCISS